MAENELSFSVSKEVTLEHLYHFAPSLKNFPERYQHLFFKGPEIPKHYPYLCPLCLIDWCCLDATGFYFSADFSLDHFPPKSCGGSLQMMVCKQCNNEAGHEYDYSLKERLQQVSFNKKVPFSKIGGKSEISDVKGWYHNERVINQNGEFEIVLKPKLKSHSPLLDKWLKTSHLNFDWKANLTYHNPDDNKVVQAILKSAYLYCFLNWGMNLSFHQMVNFSEKS